MEPGEETCGVLTSDIHITGGSAEPLECLRPRHQFGQHLIRRDDGGYVAYETDWTCGCEMCQSDERDDWCEIYRDVSDEEAKYLLGSADAELKGFQD